MNISNKVINSPNYKTPLKCIQRNPWADNIRYFLIILVIIGHLGIPLEGRYWYWHYFRNVISVFHMPAFLIITGMYAQKGIKQHDIKKVSKRILVPYIICNFIMFLIFEALGIEKSQRNYTGSLFSCSAAVLCTVVSFSLICILLCLHVYK